MSKTWRGYTFVEWLWMLEHGPLTDWETEFLKSIKSQKELSDGQRQAFLKILRKYFPVTR